MNPSCLDYRLTEDERLAFERDGYFIIEDVLSPDHVERLITVTDRIDAEHRVRDGLAPHARQSIMNFIGMDEAYLELVDWPKTFAKVWTIQIGRAHV